MHFTPFNRNTCNLQLYIVRIFTHVAKWTLNNIYILSPVESKARGSVSIRLRSGAGYQEPGVQGEGWHTSPRCQHTHTPVHTQWPSRKATLMITSRSIVVSGADINATVIGENDPVDEVQGFLFGKLKWEPGSFPEAAPHFSLCLCWEKMTDMFASLMLGFQDHVSWTKGAVEGTKEASDWKHQ